MGFPLGFIVFAGTGIHPGPSGTTQDQIRLVAAAIAGLGWNDVAPLTWAGGPLATGLLLLGLAGGLLRSLRLWEAALLVLAAIGLLFTNPGLHAPAQYPLVFVLVVFGSLAVWCLTGEVAARVGHRQDRPPTAFRRPPARTPREAGTRAELRHMVDRCGHCGWKSRSPRDEAVVATGQPPPGVTAGTLSPLVRHSPNVGQGGAEGGQQRGRRGSWEPAITGLDHFSDRSITLPVASTPRHGVHPLGRVPLLEGTRVLLPAVVAMCATVTY